MLTATKTLVKTFEMVVPVALARRSGVLVRDDYRY
jgi:hypothetical protein